MNIGIFGGSYNPIHFGHLIVAEEIREAYNLDKIIFIPVGIPSHKNELEISSFHRFEMVKLAIKENNYFEISDIEISENRKNYTIDTLNKLKRMYIKDNLFLIIGGDSAKNFHTWKNYKEILKNIKVLVFKRKDYTEITAYDNMDILNTKIIEISSTDIRERIGNNKTIKYLLPNLVEKYIYDNNLYRRDKNVNKKRGSKN